MKVYEYTKIVSNEDLDALNHVNNVRYVDWINEAAKLHWNLAAPKRLKDQYYWVVLRHQIDYKGPAFLNDTLLIKTFVRQSEGVKSFRVPVQRRHLSREHAVPPPPRQEELREPDQPGQKESEQQGF